MSTTTLSSGAGSIAGKRSNRSVKPPIKSQDTYVKDYVRKRNLILELMVSIVFKSFILYKNFLKGTCINSQMFNTIRKYPFNASN